MVKNLINVNIKKNINKFYYNEWALIYDKFCKAPLYGL